MLRRGTKEIASAEAEPAPESLLYGEKMPIRRMTSPEETAPETVIEKSDYGITLRQSDDEFLRSSGSGWLFEITSPEGKKIKGGAASRRKAERQIRKMIAAEDRRCRRERQVAEAREKLLDELLEAGIAELTAETMISRSSDLDVERLPGGYFLIIYSYSDWHRAQWSVTATRGQEPIFQHTITSRKAQTRRQARKMALETLRERLAEKSQTD